VAHRTRTGSSDEDDGVEPRVALRVGFWLLVAATAVTAFVSVARTEAGNRRLHAGLAEFAALAAFPQGLRMASTDKPDALALETERLAGNVRQLAADRDRLLSRLEALERADATGSIPPARQPSVPAEAPDIEPSTATSRGAGSGDVPNPGAEFGVDLGAASTLDAMRGLWTTLRAKHGAALEGLRPLAAIRESANRQGIALHLVAGPLATAGAAARLCVALVAMGERCEPTVFEGQRLALR
jgi:hypothetical protein